MADEPTEKNWLPPAAPAHLESPVVSPRPRGDWPPPQREDRPPDRPRQPGSPLAMAGIVSGSVGLLLLVFSAGISFPFTIALSLMGFMLGTTARRRIEAGEPGRAGQARAAVTLAAIGLALAAIAAVVWMILAANGVTPADLQDSLQKEADRLRAR